MTISEENSKAVNVLKYILAILVVFIHIPAETRNDPVYNGFVANITRTAVPLFSLPYRVFSPRTNNTELC